MLSIAIVIGANPSKTPPLNPVPIVKAFAIAAVTVPDDPSEIGTPLIVTELFTSDALAIFESVLVDPFMVLFVNVVVLFAVATADPLDVRDVNAPDDGVIAPIVASLIVQPPSMATLLIVPPVIETELLFSVDIVPKPVMSVFGIVDDAVNTEVPLPLT